jgi:hypothetical protein
MTGTANRRNVASPTARKKQPNRSLKPIVGILSEILSFDYSAILSFPSFSSPSFPYHGKEGEGWGEVGKDGGGSFPYHGKEGEGWGEVGKDGGGSFPYHGKEGEEKGRGWKGWGRFLRVKGKALEGCHAVWTACSLMYTRSECKNPS